MPIRKARPEPSRWPWPPPGSPAAAASPKSFSPPCSRTRRKARPAAASPRPPASPLGYDVRTAVAALGNGMGVVSQDTVPLTIWCVARHLGDYEESLWTTVAALGDRDTTCAIVGGIAVLHPQAEIPAEWLADREPLANMSLDTIPE